MTGRLKRLRERLRGKVEAPFSVLRKAPRHAPGVSDGYVARRRRVGTLTLIKLVNSVPWAQLNKGELS